jgi:hypothetical protein
MVKARYFFSHIYDTRKRKVKLQMLVKHIHAHLMGTRTISQIKENNENMTLPTERGKIDKYN